jgi:hypothetical protein
MRRYMLQKGTMMISKNHENYWDQWMGTARIGFLSWVLSFNLYQFKIFYNPMPMMCDW